MKLKKRYFLILLLPAGILLNSLSFASRDLTERFYSLSFYSALSQIISFITGWIPVSVGEILLILFIFFIFWRVVLLVIRMSRAKRGKLELLIKAALNGLIIFSVIYFGFLIMWGLNYNRKSLPDIVGLDVKPASVEELKSLCISLTDKANELRGMVTEGPDEVMACDGGYKSVLNRAHEGYDAAVGTYPWLGGKYGLPKPVMLSGLMSYTDIWGIYSVYTAEPNVDIDIPSASLPSTTCHEMAHQRGFAREDEANYIAYLTCIRHPDKDFQYSGIFLALDYSLSSLYSVSPDAFYKVKAKLHDGIIRDFKAISKYQKVHTNPMQDISSKVNDIYLKANNQKNGEKSYGMVVDLLLAEQRIHK